ncbi:MAG: hypothetical protein KBA95_15255 [Acidobacteria bacterium]|nr:hypothetical protein [Acidobacteriota bacterium]
MNAAWALALALGALVLRLPVFFRTFASGDEATYSALAGALLDGRWLYSGAVDHKPPLIASTYALVYAGIGRGAIHAVHALSILTLVATALIIGVLARRLGLGRAAARAASAVYVIWASIGPGKDVLAANGELLMALPAVSALVLAASPSVLEGAGRLLVRDSWRWFAAGSLAAVAALFKYQGAAIAAPLVLLAVSTEGARPGRRPERILARLSAAGLGALAVVAAFVVPYSLRGEIDALGFWAWDYPLRYAGSLDPASALFAGVGMTVWWLGMSAGPLVLVAAGGTSFPARRLVIAWIAGAALGVASGGRFFLHYYLQLLPPLALVAGLGVARLLERHSPASRRRLAAAATLTSAAAAISWGVNAAEFRLHPDRARHDAAYRAVGAYVASRTVSGEGIFVWGNSPEIYHYAARPMGTRFPFCNYQSGKIWGTPADEPGAAPAPRQVVGASWPMLLSDLELRAPAFVLDAAAAGLDRWAGHEIARYPRLASAVQERYRLVAVVSGVAIYQRRESAETASVGHP